MFSKSAPFTGDASQSSGFLRGPSPAPLRVGVDYHFKMIQLSATLTQLEPLNNGFTLSAASWDGSPFLLFAQAGSGAIAMDYLMSAKVAKAISPSVT
jgi:hypothetical protein